MTVHDPSETADEVHRLKQEIDRLTQEQSKALKQAIYTGMTPDEAKIYDRRRSRITELVQQLAMEKSQ